MYAHGRGLHRENTRKGSKKLGRGEEGWEKKIQRQCGKRRGKEIGGMDRRKWMGRIEWEQTKGRRKRGNSDRLRNSKRRSIEKSRIIQNRRESRVGPSPARNKYL
jgi:hypothetical protein